MTTKKNTTRYHSTGTPRARCGSAEAERRITPDDRIDNGREGSAEDSC